MRAAARIVTSAGLIVAALVSVSACMPTPASSGSIGHGADSSTSDPVSVDLVGSGCAAYARANPRGAGSIVGMFTDPVVVAASHNPDLTTFVRAVSGRLNPKVDLVSTLDGSQFTIFAPVDTAFAKIPPSTMAALGKPAGATSLTSILNYHVVAGQITPDALDGMHKTIEGDSVSVTGSGDDVTVNGDTVICGGLHTANATVYLIDGVLMPPNE